MSHYLHLASDLARAKGRDLCREAARDRLLAEADRAAAGSGSGRPPGQPLWLARATWLWRASSLGDAVGSRAAGPSPAYPFPECVAPPA